MDTIADLRAALNAFEKAVANGSATEQQCSDLIAQLQQYQQHIEKRAVQARYNEALLLAKQAGFASLEDLAFAATGQITPVSPLAATHRALPPKFRNPGTGELWAGRGKKPRWLQEKLDAGANIEEFRIS